MSNHQKWFRLLWLNNLFWITIMINGLMLHAGLAQIEVQTGMLKFEIKDEDADKLIPGKLMFQQDGSVPEVRVKSDELIASRNNTVYSGDGLGEIILPAGKFDVWVGRGLEYSVSQYQIEIKPGETSLLSGKIRREVDTRGYVGGDMHLHTLTYSGHGDATMEERIISCIGEGLEWAVATDHNHHTDYQLINDSLGLTQEMATTIGNEVSTPIGHFNAYPLPSNIPVIDADHNNANQLFELIHSLGDPVVVQVNHPRWPGSAYFTEKKLDEYFAESSETTWSWDFDALEILNENRGLGWSVEQQNPHSVKQDWFNMLNSGRRFTGVGNSDSHTVEGVIAGVPRNYIASSTDDASQISESELASSILAQNVSVSGGIYLEFSTSKGEPIGSQVMATNGEVEFHIRAQAPGWISCDSVFLVANGNIQSRHAATSSGQALRFQTTITVKPALDTWYMVYAKGAGSTSPMAGDIEGPNLPVGFTNPIWVDADRDGKFTSVREYAATLIREHIQNPPAILSRLENRPAMQVAVLYILSEQDNPVQETILSGLLNQQPSLRMRMLIYRQLARIGSASARTVLQNAARAAIVPLERIELAVCLAQFEDAADNGDAEFAKQLAYIRKAYLNYPTNGKMNTWYMLKNEDAAHITSDYLPNIVIDPLTGIDNSNAWGKYTVDASGFFGKGIGINSKPRIAYLYTELYSHYSGEMPFLLESRHPLTIWVNGHEHHYPDAQENFPTTNFPVLKGKNTYLVSVQESDTGLLMEPLDYQDWFDASLSRKTVHRHLAFNKTTEIVYPYSSKYKGGENALTDGLRGSTSYSDRFWQGFEATDLDVTIDLEQEQEIHGISAGFLHDDNSWIFLPDHVTFSVSTDGENYSPVGQVEHTMPVGPQNAFIKNYSVSSEGISARYVRVYARNIKQNPDWHKAPGGKSWVFVDEILVE